jgi:hypothetical protein
MSKYLLVALLFASCASPYKLVKTDKYRTEKELTILAGVCADVFPSSSTLIIGKDTTIYKDSIILIPGEMVIDTFKIDCPDTERSKSNGKTHVTLQIKEGKAKIICKADSITAVLENVIREKHRVDVQLVTDSARMYLLTKRLAVAEARVQELETKKKQILPLLGWVAVWFIKQWWFWVLVAVLTMHVTHKYTNVFAWIKKLVTG